MTKRFLIAVALSSQAIAFPLLIASAHAGSLVEPWACQSSAASTGGADAGAAPGTGLTEGSVSTNSAAADIAAADIAAADRARRSGMDPGATGVAGVMPINIPSPAVEGIDPATGVGAEFHGGWGTAQTADLPVAPPPASYGSSTASMTVIDRGSIRSVTDCLNAAARVGASLDRCER